MGTKKTISHKLTSRLKKLKTGDAVKVYAMQNKGSDSNKIAYHILKTKLRMGIIVFNA